MALYMLRVQTIDRGSGRTVVAAAAYRSGTCLNDQRLDMQFDFSRKRDGIAHTAILAPENAPPEFLDRETLWNAVEAADKRKDSVPAQEILVALPHELDDGQRRELVEDFAQASLVDRGMIADIAIHYPGREGDERNHHAHILVTTRKIGPDGFGSKNRDWNSRDFVVEIRREWAEVQNRHLERLAPSVEKVSEKSLADQGIDREPTEHLGPEVLAMERRGERTDRGENNRNIDDRNKGLEQLDRQLDREVADSWRARKWIQRPADDVIREMDSVRAAMVRQRDAWRAERDAITAPKPPSVRKLEAELTRKEAAAYRRALEREEAAKARAQANGVPLRRIAQWWTNPARAMLKSLVAWNEDLDRIARARRETERAKRALEARRAWTKSDAGRAHIHNLRQPALDGAAAARTQQRTLDRKIKRMNKRLEEADEDILQTKVAKRLGVERLRTPSEIPQAEGRSVANTRRYFRFMSAEARAAFAKAPEQDIAAALKFLRGLAPGAPIPSARPAAPTPDLTPPFPSGRAPRAPDLPDL